MAMHISSSTTSTKPQQAPQQNQTQHAAPKAKTAEQQPKPAQQAHKPEQPKPVVNAQGQTTGKTINVTA